MRLSGLATRLRTGWTHLLLATLLFFVAAVPASAQTVTGTITGTVVDNTGAVVVGASVTLTSETTGAVRQTKTTESGVFVFAAVPPSTCTIKVEVQGFRAFQRTGIVLTANDRVALGNIEMTIGQITETVTVEARGAAVNTESAESTALLSSNQLNDMMVKGRDIVNLLRVLPGVSQIISGGADSLGGRYGTFLPNISGARDAWLTTNLDGQTGSDADIVKAFNGATSVDAIAEVKVVLNSYQAEYGRNSGPTVNIVSKSGTREFHGSLYWYKRHETFNANDFFNNRGGLRRPVYRFANFGVTLGGPVYVPGKFNRNKDKLFFFFSEEEWRSKTPQGLLRYTVPTELERRGDFSQTIDQNGRLVSILDPNTGAQFPGNAVPASRINSNGQKLLGVLPLPNALDRSITKGAYNYEFQDIQNVPKRGQLMKLDILPTAKDTISIRPRRWWADTNAYTAMAGFYGIPLVYHHYLFTEDSANVSWTRIVSPAVVNEVNSGFRGLKELGNAKTPDEFKNFYRSTYGITLSQLNPQINPQGFLPEGNFGGIPGGPSYTLDARTPIDCGDERFHLSDNLSWIRGAHTMKFGLFLERNWASEGWRAAGFTGSLDWGIDTNNPNDTRWPFSNALLGNFRSYSEASNKVEGLGKNFSVEWFAQDTWKVSRKLTLNYGLRFSWFTPWRLRVGEGAAFVSERYDRAKAPAFYRPALDPSRRRVAQNPLTGALSPAVFIGAYVPGSGDVVNGMVRATDKTYPDGFRVQQPVQVSPRAGFAYDVFGNGKTALRGGFGISKQTMPSVGQYTTTMALQPPTQFRPTMYYGNLDTFLSTSGVLFPTSVAAYQKDDIVPSVYNFSFGIQQNIGRATVVDASYVGNIGRHLIQAQDLNTVPYGARFLAQNIDPTNGLSLPDNFFRPYPGYGSITYRETSGSSNYNALQTTANRRFAHGVQFGVAYTWSKAMGLSSGDSGGISRYNNRKVWNYAPLSFDQMHIFVANYLWDVPKLSKYWNNALVRQAFDNWQLSGITTFSSGNPRGIGLATSDNADISGGGDGTRVVVIAAPQLPRGERSFSRWFNTDAFARPAKGTFGNAAATVFRGPGLNNWDLTAMKNFPMGSERRFLRFRAEFYNAFNKTQFDGTDGTARFDPAGKQINGQFGQVTSTRSPRVIQLSLSLNF